MVAVDADLMFEVWLISSPLCGQQRKWMELHLADRTGEWNPLNHSQNRESVLFNSAEDWHCVGLTVKSLQDPGPFSRCILGVEIVGKGVAKFFIWIYFWVHGPVGASILHLPPDKLSCRYFDEQARFTSSRIRYACCSCLSKIIFLTLHHLFSVPVEHAHSLG